MNVNRSGINFFLSFILYMLLSNIFHKLIFSSCYSRWDIDAIAKIKVSCRFHQVVNHFWLWCWSCIQYYGTGTLLFPDNPMLYLGIDPLIWTNSWYCTRFGTITQVYNPLYALPLVSLTPPPPPPKPSLSDITLIPYCTLLHPASHSSVYHLLHPPWTSGAFGPVYHVIQWQLHGILCIVIASENIILVA